jgi:sec-independent protein translocase protein TatA
MFNIGTPELVIILVIVLLLFGGKKLPELSRSLGEAIREFRKSLNTDTDDAKKKKKDPTSSRDE